MAAITGSNAFIIAKKATTFGTAVAGGASDKMEVESFADAQNPEILQATPIGSGLDMQNDAQVGATSPSIDIEKIAGYNDAGTFLESLFFGGASVTNVSNGAFQHSITYNGTRNQSWATIARLAATGSVIEYAAATPIKFSVQADTPPDYVRHTINCLANSRSITSSTNTAATIATATLADTRRVVVKPTDVFMLNNRTAIALSAGSNAYAVKSVNIEYSIDGQHVQEIKNSAGNGQVVLTGSPPFTAVVTVEFRNMADFTFFTAQDNGTEYKAAFEVTDTLLIGGTHYYQRGYYFPCLKVLNDPSNNLTTPAENPLTVVFTSLVAPTIPTGMLDRLPYMFVKNTKSAAFL